MNRVPALRGWRSSRAISNARGALSDIAAAVEARRLMYDALEHPSGPGGLERLSSQCCLDLLATRSFGRLAFLAREGRPDCVPVNYVLDDGAVVIRSGPGPKLQAGERREHVAFEVDSIDEATRTGWSVVVTGRAEVLDVAHHASVTQPDPWATGPRSDLLRIVPGRLEGRRLH